MQLPSWEVSNYHQEFLYRKIWPKTRNNGGIPSGKFRFAYHHCKCYIHPTPNPCSNMNVLIFRLKSTKAVKKLVPNEDGPDSGISGYLAPAMRASTLLNAHCTRHLCLLWCHFSITFQMRIPVLLLVFVFVVCYLHVGAASLWQPSRWIPTHKRAYRVRDPKWRPCLTMCVDGCSPWKEFNLNYCARQCMDYPIFNFVPERNCFDYKHRFWFGLNI